MSTRNRNLGTRLSSPETPRYSEEQEEIFRMDEDRSFYDDNIETPDRMILDDSVVVPDAPPRSDSDYSSMHSPLDTSYRMRIPVDNFSGDEDSDARMSGLEDDEDLDEDVFEDDHDMPLPTDATDQLDGCSDPSSDEGGRQTSQSDGSSSTSSQITVIERSDSIDISPSIHSVPRPLVLRSPNSTIEFALSPHRASFSLTVPSYSGSLENSLVMRHAMRISGENGPININAGRSRILSETSSSHATLAALPPTGRSRAQSAPSFRAMMERQVGQGLQQISDQFERENRMGHFRVNAIHSSQSFPTQLLVTAVNNILVRRRSDQTQGNFTRPLRQRSHTDSDIHIIELRRRDQQYDRQDSLDSQGFDREHDL